MNFDTTDYATDDVDQVDVGSYIQEPHSLRSKTLLSDFCVLIKERSIAMMDSWML
jgi:hypothetical protein